MLRFATIAGTALLLILPAAAQQQDSSAPAQQQQSQQQQPSQTDTKDQQKKAEKKKSGSDANSFPEAQSEKAAQQPDQQPDSNVPAAPQPSSQKDQAAPANKPSTTDQNPFPEAESEKAAHQEQQQEQKDQTPPDGDDSSYSSSQVHMKGMDPGPAAGGDEDTAPIQASSPLPYDPKLAKKDAQIGDFYMETGDFKGAYDRFVEAARSDPGNAEAVWGLAESAQHLQMNQVAIKNYRLYLSALPNGPHAKEIRKTLKEMGLEPGS